MVNNECVPGWVQLIVQELKKREEGTERVVMPTTLQKRRNIAINDKLWHFLEDESEKRNVSISFLIRETVKEKYEHAT